MRISDITEAMVRRQFEATIFSRGESYLKQGAVQSPKARENGTVLTAEVQGSDIDPYEVRIVLGKTHIDSAECSCPYNEEWAGWCKHIAAVLLTAARFPERFGDIPALAELLKDLDRDALESILMELANSDDQIADDIADIARQRSETVEVQAAEPNRAVIPVFPSVDVEALRKQIRQTLRSDSRRSNYRRSDYYDRGGAELMEIQSGPIDNARTRLERGDILGALAILEVTTDTVCSDYDLSNDHEGYAYGLFEELDSLWTEAIVSLEIVPSAQEKQWTKLLESGQESIEDYGYEVFDAPLAALREGWNDPALEKVLHGETDRLYGGNLRVNPIPLLTTARMTVLKRQGRFEEALRLASATDNLMEAVSLMVQLGRHSEIRAFAKSRIPDGRAALLVVRTLEQSDALDVAIDVAEEALNLPTQWPSEHSLLASWLRDAAESVGDRESAIRAAIIALHGQPSFSNFERAHELVPLDTWPALRDETIERLRQPTDSHLTIGLNDRVEIYLSEKLHGDALNAVRKEQDHSILERVAVATSETHPDAVIALSQRVAEGIMDSGASGQYEIAQHWLHRIKEIQTRVGRATDWDTYLKSLMEMHKRKYKMMALLKELV